MLVLSINDESWRVVEKETTREPRERPGAGSEHLEHEGPLAARAYHRPQPLRTLLARCWCSHPDPMDDPAASCQWADMQQHATMPHRKTGWAKARAAAQQSRKSSVATAWDAVFGEQQIVVGRTGWLSKLKQRLLGAPQRNLRGSFGAARAKARASFIDAQDDRDKVIPNRTDARDPLAKAADHLIASDDSPEATVSGSTDAGIALRTGWRGSVGDNVVEGLFETPDDIRKRRTLRRAPEVQAQVRRLWDVAHKWQERMAGAAYFDFHLSIFHYIIE